MLGVTPDADVAIIGAGLSGLLLARALLTSPPTGPGTARPRVLLADPRPAPAGQSVTYSSWADRPTPLDPWRIGSWRSLRTVAHDGTVRAVALQRWRYDATDWGRARADLLAEVGADPRVTLLLEPVQTVRDSADGTRATVQGATTQLTARWAFDSRPPSVEDLRTGFGTRPVCRPPALLQTFCGVWVHADADVADPATATLLDFSADDGPELGFAYVLPVSARTLMVMAVRMGTCPDLPDPMPAIARAVGATPWRPGARESGITPLVAAPAPRRLGRRVLAIGRRGGRVRPSTGYALQRIAADAAAVSRSLDEHGHPFAVPPDPPWQRALDRVWLRALARERAGFEPALLSLFTGAPVDSVLRFLDGDARPRDVAAVVRALPPAPFLRALAG